MEYETFGYYVYQVQMEAYYEGVELNKLEETAIAMLDLLTEAAVQAVCDRDGHDPDDIGYPETGCVHVVCSRCGATLAYQRLY